MVVGRLALNREQQLRAAMILCGVFTVGPISQVSLDA